jgi:hypothetical protein
MSNEPVVPIPPTMTVTIAAYMTAEAPNVVVPRVEPEFLNLTGIGDSVNIVFQVATSGYAFRDKLSGIQSLSNGWDASFTTIQYSDDMRTATVSNVNQSGLAYPYLVNVVHLASGLTGSVDPVIQNENR